MSKLLNVNPVARAKLGREMLHNYSNYIKRSPHKTPNQLVDVVYLGYKYWFDSFSQYDLNYFNKLFEKASLSVDLDVHWDVSVKKQLQASNVFNNFLSRMKSHQLKNSLPTLAKKNVKLVTQTLSEEFGKEYKIGTKSINILKAFSSDDQLKMVAKRLVSELAKLGYAF